MNDDIRLRESIQQHFLKFDGRFFIFRVGDDGLATFIAGGDAVIIEGFQAFLFASGLAGNGDGSFLGGGAMDPDVEDVE